MQSDARDVAGYLAEVPEERREALTRLRALCLKVLKGFGETMRYGMPCYERDGVVEIAFASQKQYVALYVMKTEVVERHREALSGIVGKGCIRFRKVEGMDFELIRRMLEETIGSKSIPCA